MNKLIKTYISTSVYEKIYFIIPHNTFTGVAKSKRELYKIKYHLDLLIKIITLFRVHKILLYYKTY